MSNSPKRFEDYFKEAQRQEAVSRTYSVFELETYKGIQGTPRSYRKGPGKPTVLAQQHVHVYAKRKGGGKQLFSVTIDGSGHSGPGGYAVPTQHAGHLRGLGYSIPNDNILECILLDPKDKDVYALILMDDRNFRSAKCIESVAVDAGRDGHGQCGCLPPGGPSRRHGDEPAIVSQLPTVTGLQGWFDWFGRRSEETAEMAQLEARDSNAHFF